jgi:dihydroneopterin aldolase
MAAAAATLTGVSTSSTPTDRVVLRGLRGYGRHGVLESERRLGQTFLVDLAVELDTRAAADADDVSQTVDYADVARAVLDIVEGEPVALLETLAQRICDAILGHDLVQAVDVTVHKPSAPVQAPFDDIAVSIRRTRE